MATLYSSLNQSYAQRAARPNVRITTMLFLLSLLKLRDAMLFGRGGQRWDLFFNRSLRAI